MRAAFGCSFHSFTVFDVTLKGEAHCPGCLDALESQRLKGEASATQGERSVTQENLLPQKRTGTKDQRDPSGNREAHTPVCSVRNCLCY